MRSPQLHKISAKNTKIIHHDDESVEVLYKTTRIAYASTKDDSLRITTGGWITPAMLTRINQTLAAFKCMVRVRYQTNRKDGYTELAAYKLIDNSVTVTEPFVDGVVKLDFSLPV